MISVIICSRLPDIPQSLVENIAETIGLEYELIIIDNSENKYTIFQAYNKGMRGSKYPYLCFMHDDILYHTVDWGKKVMQHFKEQNIGLIGVAGGHYLPDCPSGWWSTEYRSGILIQGDKHSQGNADIKKWIRYTDGMQSPVSVAAIDGLWFCMPKSIAEKITFDEAFPGFNCYDTDLSMQIHQLGYQVNVVFDILIEHFSSGKYDSQFMKDTEQFYIKWKTTLPVIKGIQLSDNDIEDRKYFVQKEIEMMETIFSLKRELKCINHSKPYRLGKALIKPFSVIFNQRLRATER